MVKKTPVRNSANSIAIATWRYGPGNRLLIRAPIPGWSVTIISNSFLARWVLRNERCRVGLCFHTPRFFSWSHPVRHRPRAIYIDESLIQTVFRAAVVFCKKRNAVAARLCGNSIRYNLVITAWAYVVEQSLDDVLATAYVLTIVPSVSIRYRPVLRIWASKSGDENTGESPSHIWIDMSRLRRRGLCLPNMAFPLNTTSKK